MKIDLERAYDRLDWEFLEHVLIFLGFDEKIWRLILFCFTSCNLFICWDGRILDPITPTRGLLQGDPLSSYLFIWAMEFLLQQIDKAIQQKGWKSIKLARGGLVISHLFFY